jgi:hypothetical protein
MAKLAGIFIHYNSICGYNDGVATFIKEFIGSL